MEFQNCKGYLIALMSLDLNGINNENDGTENFHNLHMCFL